MIRSDDAVIFGLSAAGLIALILTVDRLHRRAGMSPEWGRHIVHLLVGLYLTISPILFVRPDLVMALAAAFVPLNLVAARRRWFAGMHDVGRRTDGTATFPFAFLVAAWCCWLVDPERTPVLQAAFLVLALADPLAAVVGGRWGRTSVYRLGGDQKSRIGSAAFLAVSVAAIAGVMRWSGYLDGVGTFEWWVVVVVAAGVATLAEAMGRAGWDNLFVVLGVMVVLAHAHPSASGDSRLLPAAILAIAAGLGTHRTRLLEAGGAAGAGLLAFTIVWLAGWVWLLPGAVFFLLSSGLSRVGRDRKARHAVQPARSGPRDLVQVFANGGVAWGLVAVPGLVGIEASWTALAFCGAFAAAAADTWATELGGLSRRMPRLVTTWKRVPAGTSGGVTVVGLLAATAGSMSVAAAGWLIGVPFVPVLMAGLAGSLVDSLLGATIQVKWTNKAGAVSESEPAGNSVRTGIRWMTNDAVNLLCTAAGAILAVALS